MKKVLSVHGDRDCATLSRVASGLRFPALRDGDAYAQRRAHATVMLPQRTGRFVPCTRELAREPQKPCVVQRATTETNRPKMRRAELGSRTMTRHASGVVSNWVCPALAATVLFRNRLATPPVPSEPSVQRKRSCRLAQPALLFLSENAAGHDRTPVIKEVARAVWFGTGRPAFRIHSRRAGSGHRGRSDHASSSR